MKAHLATLVNTHRMRGPHGPNRPMLHKRGRQSTLKNRPQRKHSASGDRSDAQTTAKHRTTISVRP